MNDPPFFAVGRRAGGRNVGRRVRGLCVGAAMLLAIVPCVRAHGPASEAKPLVISAIVNEQTHAMAKHVLREAYARMGIGIRFDDLPGRRALEWANSGRTDGDVARIEGTETKYPNLVPVGIPVIHFDGVAFSKDSRIRINTWEDLRGRRIGVVRGIRYSAIGTEGMAPYFANDMTHLFTILDKGRIEVAVAVRDAGKIEIAKNFNKSGIRVCGPPLYSAPLYHFLHKRNRSIAEKLASILGRMTASGEMETLWRQAFERLLAQ